MVAIQNSWYSSRSVCVSRNSRITLVRPALSVIPAQTVWMYLIRFGNLLNRIGSCSSTLTLWKRRKPSIKSASDSSRLSSLSSANSASIWSESRFFSTSMSISNNSTPDAVGISSNPITISLKDWRIFERVSFTSPTELSKVVFDGLTFSAYCPRSYWILVKSRWTTSGSLSKRVKSSMKRTIWADFNWPWRSMNLRNSFPIIFVG